MQIEASIRKFKTYKTERKQRWYIDNLHNQTNQKSLDKSLTYIADLLARKSTQISIPSKVQIPDWFWIKSKLD